VHLGRWGAREEGGWRRTVPVGLTETERGMDSGLDTTKRGGGSVEWRRVGFEVPGALAQTKEGGADKWHQRHAT
jgi:hypothetical protein